MEKGPTGVALMRYRILAPLLDPDLKKGDRKAILENLSGKTYMHPNTGDEIRVQPETVRHWLKQYRKHGFEGLHPKTRRDKGTSRAIPDSLVTEAVNLKLEHPRRTVDGIIAILERSGKAHPGQLRRSTLHRIFVARNINIRKEKKSAVFGRFEAEYANDRWQSDMMFGPWLPDPERPGKNFQAILMAFIDDHSRLVVHGQFYRYQSLENLEDTLRKAIGRRGVPRVIYVDNGKAYRSGHLASVCAQLGIRLIFTQPYKPEGKGKIEKFWSFVRSSFMPEVEVAQILTLDRLNQSFQAWLEVHYHHKQHSETGQTPLKRYLKHPDRIRRADPDTLRDAFLYREDRKIRKDCCFSLKGRDYEVQSSLAGQRVMAVYDPEDMDQIRILVSGHFYQVAKPVRIRAHVRKKAATPQAAEKPDTGFRHLEQLEKEHMEQTRELLAGTQLQEPVEASSAPANGSISPEQFIGILQKHRKLDPLEEKEIRKFFRTAGRITNPFALKILDLAIRQSGPDRHIDFYLSLLEKEVI